MADARTNVEVLRKHKARIEGCNTFEAFKDVQLELLSWLISDYERQDRELIESARLVLQNEEQR